MVDVVEWHVLRILPSHPSYARPQNLGRGLPLLPSTPALASGMVPAAPPGPVASPPGPHPSPTQQDAVQCDVLLSSLWFKWVGAENRKKKKD